MVTAFSVFVAVYLAIGTVAFVLWSWYGDSGDNGVPALVVGLVWPFAVLGVLAMWSENAQLAIRKVRERSREVPTPEPASYRSDNRKRCETCGQGVT